LVERFMTLTDRLHELDRFQQRHRGLSFLAAVVKKFSEDQASQLAALIAYYGSSRSSRCCSCS
jgi:hypothetical protein